MSHFAAWIALAILIGSASWSQVQLQPTGPTVPRFFPWPTQLCDLYCNSPRGLFDLWKIICVWYCPNMSTTPSVSQSTSPVPQSTSSTPQPAPSNNPSVQSPPKPITK